MKILFINGLLVMSFVFTGCLGEDVFTDSGEGDLSKEGDEEDDGSVTVDSSPSGTAVEISSATTFGGQDCYFAEEESDEPQDPICEPLPFVVDAIDLELYDGAWDLKWATLSIPDDSISCAGACALELTFTMEYYSAFLEGDYADTEYTIDFNNDRVEELGLIDEIGAFTEPLSLNFDTYDVESFPGDGDKSYHLTLEADLTIKMDAVIPEGATLETPSESQTSDDLKWFAFCYELRNNIDDSGYSLGDSTGVYYQTYFHVISTDKTSYDANSNQLTLALTAGNYDPAIVSCGAISYVDFDVAGADVMVNE